MTEERTRSRAFEQELLSLRPALQKFALSLYRDPAKAEDLVQDTMVKALKNAHSYEMGTLMKAWLFTIMRNEFYSNMRRAKYVVEDPDGVFAAKMVTSATQEHAVELSEVRKRIRMMPRAMRVALAAVAENGEQYEEVAERLGVAIGTMKSRVSRARKFLESGLKVILDEPEAELSPEDASTLDEGVIMQIQAGFAKGASISELSAKFGVSSAEIMPLVVGIKRRRAA